MNRFPLWIAMVGVAIGIGTAAHAATGTLTMSWDVCAPVVTHKVNSTAPASLIFSVLGCDETHTAYQVRLLLTDANNTTPDAWRFDAGGCQTNQLIQIRSDPPAALVKTCPAFKGTDGVEIVKNFAKFPPGDPLPYHETQMRGVLAVTYSAVTANPAQRYFLGEFRFDHFYSVSGTGTPGLTCGGNETPVTLMIIPPSGLIRASDGLEYPFDVPFPSNVTYGPPLTPAHAATWGQIKSQYR